MPADTTTDTRHLDQPTYWFAVLEIARERGDFDRAAEAKRQLRRLGVCVSYRQPVHKTTEETDLADAYLIFLRKFAGQEGME